MAVIIGSAALVVGFFALIWPDTGPAEPSGLTGPEPAGEGPRAANNGSGPGSSGPGGLAFRPHQPAPRRGANLHGTVRWDDGSAVAGAEVALVDEGGEVIAETLTDDQGVYALEDALLAGNEVQVTEPLGDAHQRDLSPLRSGENRVFDVVLGEQREVVGWVLDSLGDPQPGVSVTLGWERGDSKWRAITDSGGAFTFVDVPATPLRVTADGGDLGLASARLAQTDQTRREVTLVLEPVGTIFVRPSPEVAKLGEVVVRCFAATAHGSDGLWNDDMRTPDVIYEGEPVYDVPDVAPEGVPEDGAPIEEPPIAHEQPSMEEIESMLGSALREWDTADPEGSLVRLAVSLATSNGVMADELRQEVERENPGSSGASLEELARMAAQKAIKEQPMILDMMGIAASKVREGVSPMQAFMAAGNEMAERQPSSVAIEADPIAEPEPGDGEELLGEDTEAEPGEGELEGEGEYVGNEGDLVAEPLINDEGDPYALGEGENPDPYYLAIERIRAETGVDLVEAVGEARSQVASGRFLEPIPVRGSFEYQVSVRHPDGFEIVCGTVFVPAGEEVEVVCGKSGPAIVTGRVVDTAGAPIEGAVIDVFWGETMMTTTDKNGRYQLSVPLPSAQLLTIGAHDPSYSQYNALKRNQNVRPGVTTEVPDIVARRPEEMPTFSLTEPYGGVGASIGLASEGIMVTGLFDDGPLALAGVESGDTILRINEELGASLSIEDALLLLRGEAGTEVDLTLRSSEGELYELAVTRGLVNPMPEGAVDPELPQYENIDNLP